MTPRICFVLLHCLVFLLVICAASVGNTAHAQDLALVKRFLAEAPPAWRAYEEATQYAQGLRKSAGLYEGKKQRETSRFKKNKNCRLLEFVELVADEDNRVATMPLMLIADNPDYGFLLQRATPEQEWQLIQVTPDAGSDWPWEVTEGNIHPTFVRGASLVDVLADPGFLIDEIKVVAEDRWQVDFKIDARTVKHEQLDDIKHGTLLLDIAKHWRLTSFSVTFAVEEGDVRAMQYDLEYADGQDVGDFDLPVKAAVSLGAITDDAGGLEISSHYTVESQFAVPEKLPHDAEFYLTAFGLPEPDLEDAPCDK